MEETFWYNISETWGGGKGGHAFTAKGFRIPTIKPGLPAWNSGYDKDAVVRTVPLGRLLEFVFKGQP